MPKKKQEGSANPNLLLNSKETEQGRSCHHLMLRGSFDPRDSSKGKAAPLCVRHMYLMPHTKSSPKRRETTQNWQTKNPKLNEKINNKNNSPKKPTQKTKRKPSKQMNKQTNRVSLTTLVNMESKSAYDSFLVSLLWQRTSGKTQTEVRKLEVSRLIYFLGSSCCCSCEWSFLSV